MVSDTKNTAQKPPPAPELPSVESGCIGNDPREAAAVRKAWALVDAYERFGTQASEEGFGHELKAWFDHARATVENLVPWEGAMNHGVYRNDNNRLRFRRTLDLIRPGETVFDVGFGRGYLCGLLLRDRAIAAYHGIDVGTSYVDYVANMLDSNGFSGDNVHVTLGDLYKLNREIIANTGATVIVCCEVLEHVPDPEKALITLAEALPDGADLIFSVPMYGRMEQVWGHLSVFDTARLKSMCSAASLYVHHAEPVANSWTFIVASRSKRPSARVLEADRAAPSALAPLISKYEFVNVEASAMQVGQWARRTDCRLKPTSTGEVRCDVTGHDPATAGGRGQYAGVTFPVDGLTALRVRVGVPETTSVERLFVEAYHRSERIARWQSAFKSSWARGAPRRWSFRLGEETRGFTYSGPDSGRAEVDRVEIFVRLAAGSKTWFTVGSAYLSGDAQTPEV